MMTTADNEDTQETKETVAKAQVTSFCRHLGRSLKGVGSSDATLALDLMRESEHLRQNGFGDAAEMFATVAGVLDPSLPIKMDHARRMV